jgi:hypothetical protein
MVVSGLLAVSAAVMPRASAAAQTGWKTVDDHSNQISMTVPSGWTVQSPSGNVTLQATGPAPVAGALPDTADAVIHGALGGMTPQSCINEAQWIGQHFGHINSTTVSAGPTTVGGLPAYARVYTWKTSKSEPRWSRQQCVVKNGTVYVVTATTENTAPGLAKRQAVLERIMSSFDIVSAPASRTPPAENPIPANGGTGGQRGH